MSLSASEQERALKFEQHLKQEPYSGKPLGYEFFREKKFGGKRLLFLVYNEHNSVLLVTITDKKTQQAAIDLIKSGLDAYKETIDKIINRLKLP